MFIYEQPKWPEFDWDPAALTGLLANVRNLQGRIVGQMEALGFDLKAEASLETVALDVLKSSEIEGEMLATDQVRSSVARRLGMDIAGMVPSSRNVDGVVDMLLDATQHARAPLDKDRLFGWHKSLFPQNPQRRQMICVGQWREDESGRMQVISGPVGSERIHFIAPPSRYVDFEMDAFLKWFNAPDTIDPVLKSGIAHLWFLTIHPFDDGNGRIARAITDLMLARADGIPQRFYSMSNQIKEDRKGYYALLEQTQKGGLDITPWLTWYLECLQKAILASAGILGKVFEKHSFWASKATKGLNGRQILMLNKLLDGFQGKLTSTKWGQIAKCSPDTALRDIHDLIERGILVKEEGGGRSTSYVLKPSQPGSAPFPSR